LKLTVPLAEPLVLVSEIESICALPMKTLTVAGVRRVRKLALLGSAIAGLTIGRADWLGFFWDTYFIKGFGRFPVMNFYYAGHWRRGEPRAADDAASAAWVPIASLSRLRKRFAWAHMTPLLRGLARWARS